MHIDEGKKFDRRNIERNMKNGVISQKDYEIYLSKLSDISDKVFNPEESLVDDQGLASAKNEESLTRRRVEKKRVKGKVK